MRSCSGKYDAGLNGSYIKYALQPFCFAAADSIEREAYLAEDGRTDLAMDGWIAKTDINENL